MAYLLDNDIILCQMDEGKKNWGAFVGLELISAGTKAHVINVLIALGFIDSLNAKKYYAV